MEFKAKSFLAFCLCFLLASSSHAACPDVVGTLTSACQQYVVGPSPPAPTRNSQCCMLIKPISVPCLCSGIPSYAFQVINKNAVSKLIGTCGITIPAGTSCGGL